jgi:WD40 repeat protein
MNARIAALLLGLALVTAACTTSQDQDASPQVPKNSTTVPGKSEPPLLLITDAASAVVVIQDNGTVIETIEPPTGTRYSQPIWASPSTIVYAQIAPEDNRLEAVRLGGDTVWSVELDTPAFYYLAALASDSTTVVSLRNKTDGSGLIIERISAEASPLTLSEEAPFYASWNPTDGRLASHVGDTRLDITGSVTETIDANASGFQAPVWLAAGLVSLRSRGDDTYLTLWDDSSFSDIARVRGASRFVGSGDSIAIVTGGNIETGGIQALAQALPTINSGVLTVIDLEETSFTSVTSDPTPIFQWDRAGERLLYVTFVNDPTPALVWHIWEDGEVTDFQPFVPDPSWFATVAPFFDQYAQSVSLWSPDGTAFAYPALVEGEARILIQHLDETGPLDIAAGIWVTWSPAR